MPYNWVNLITTKPCSPEPCKSWFIQGKSSPFMAELFRLVKYDNLPRCMPYMLTFTINIPPMLVYIPYMDIYGSYGIWVLLGLKISQGLNIVGGLEMFGTWLLFIHILGMSSSQSQLTFTHIFQRGSYTTNQYTPWHNNIDKKNETCPQSGAPQIAKLVFYSNNYGLWYL